MPSKTSSPVWHVWKGMMARCYDSNSTSYPRYGGRGITVCQEWHEFRSFERDTHPRPVGHQIDRIDNDGPYSPSNCRWVSPEYQNRNKRNSRYITALGRTQLLTDWCLEFDLLPGLLANRLKTGWPPDIAVTTPPHSGVRKKKGRLLLKTRMETINGITKPFREWVSDSGLSLSGVRKRLKAGWSLEDALSVASHFGGRRQSQFGHGQRFKA